MDLIFHHSHAKINLTLDILGLRNDGYHNISSIMQTVSLCDSVIVKRNGSAKIKITTNLKYLCSDENNICYKTAALYFEEAGIQNAGVDIHIDKVIPVGAGLGGGSANAASVIKALEKLFAPLEDRTAFAAKIGADVPFCLQGGSALCEGIGERITPVQSIGGNVYLVIAKGARKIPNKIVYGKYDEMADSITSRPDNKRMVSALKNRDIGGICANMRNVFEDVVIPEIPSITKLKEKIYDCGAIGVMMSGSGPSVFGIFEKEADAKACAEKIRTSRVCAYAARFL